MGPFQKYLQLPQLPQEMSISPESRPSKGLVYRMRPGINAQGFIRTLHARFLLENLHERVKEIAQAEAMTGDRALQRSQDHFSVSL
jgi:hypothetical protein